MPAGALNEVTDVSSRTVMVCPAVTVAGLVTVRDPSDV
jgi:hypothetical protein